MKEVVLAPIKETTEDYEAIEAHIATLWKKEMYEPLLSVINESPKVLKNSLDDLISAIDSGRINFYRGHFRGRFNSTVSRELKKIGAKWDRTQGSWKIPLSSLPIEIKEAINVSQNKFQRKVDSVLQKLQQIMPEKIADKLQVQQLFDSTLWKAEGKIKQGLKGITVEPRWTSDRREAMARDYEKNMKLYIQDWTQKEIVNLRQRMQKHALSGMRYEDMVDTIKKSYGVSHNKAKFLARQETSLLMARFKQERYAEAGVDEYIWGCVVGSPNHPVRPMHKKLDGKRFKFNNPPVTDENGNRNNPGQDYNCRCYPRPVVRFDK